jgi:hypothetical protein
MGGLRENTRVIKMGQMVEKGQDIEGEYKRKATIK